MHAALPVCVCVSLGFIGLHKVENELMIPVNCQHLYIVYLYILRRNRAASPSRLCPTQLLLLLLICRTFIRANY